MVRGRLRPASEAPPTGEYAEEVARIGDVVVEHILSGTLPEPVDFDQGHDEWVVVVSGAAVLDVDGDRLDLVSGDWVMLPAHVPHRLIQTRPGTSWIALHRQGEP